jgi:hypothetical protein
VSRFFIVVLNVTLSVNDTRHDAYCFGCSYAEWCYAKCRVLFIVVLNAGMLSVKMLSVFMMNVFMLSVFILSVIMLCVSLCGVSLC